MLCFFILLIINKREKEKARKNKDNEKFKDNF
jgi:hypothetical protein